LSLATTMTSAFATTEAFVATLSGHLSNMSYGIRVNNIEGVTAGYCCPYTSRSRRTEWTIYDPLTTSTKPYRVITNYNW
jgi:hypothetical protein